MNNRFTKLCRLPVLALAALTLFISGCTGSGETGETAATGDVTASQTEETVPMILLKDYKVIRPEKSEEWEKTFAVAVKDYMDGVFARSNGRVYIETDWIKNVADLPAQAKEILVGHTNRPESEEVYASLRSEDSVVRYFPESGRLVIAGGSEMALSRAVDLFVPEYLAGERDPETCGFPADLDLSTVGIYRVSSLRFAGVDAAEYSLVTTKGPDNDDKYAASLITAAVVSASGVSLPVTTDKEVPAGTLELRTGDGTKSFALKGDPSVGGSIIKTARQFTAAYLPADAAGEIDVPLTGEAILPVIEAPEYPVLSDLGSMPVALTDQLNACAVVCDALPLLSGGQPEQKWSFAPTSALGYAVDKTYGNRIDEFKVRYVPGLNTYVFGITSSSGYIAMGEYPSGKCLWQVSESGWGPHSIEILPNGNVAVALSGNGDETRSCVRVYAASRGKDARNYTQKNVTGTHAVLWDDVRELLWVLGSKEITAYEIGGSDSLPVLNRVEVYCASGSFGGHDMSAVAGDNDRLLICGSGAYIFNKRSGAAEKNTLELKGVGTTSMKCLCTLFPDAPKTPSAARAGVNAYVIRTVAANVYASHDTDRFEIFSCPEGMLVSGGTAQKYTASFPGRAFYKARPVDPYYY